MEHSLTLIQKRAIKQFLNFIQHSGFGAGWSKLSEQFAGLIGNQQDPLPLTLYYQELNNLPASTKRLIIQKIILAWSAGNRKNLLDIHQAFEAIVSLKVCNNTEFHFLNAFYNILCYFGEVCNIEIKSYNIDEYSIIFEGFNTISFSLSPISDPEPKISIDIESCLLDSKFNYAQSANEFKPLYDELMKYLFRGDNRWMHYSSNLSASFFPGLLLSIEIKDLEYFN